MRVHFLGTGGSGISGAAAIAQAQGFEVTGCDLNPHNEFTTAFKPEQLATGHSPDHLYCHPEGVKRPKDLSTGLSPASTTRVLGFSNRRAGDSSGLVDPQKDKRKKQDTDLIDLLAVTPAIFSLDPNNPELLAAKEKGIPVMTWQQFLGEYLAKDKFVIAVCGTHGKTTTTAMIAKLLEDAGLDPTVELGAIVPSWKANYKIGKSKYFVVEADEFNDNFLHLKPDINVVTNIEMDHPEYFKDFEAVKESFKKFMLQTKTAVAVNLTDPGAAEVVKAVMKEPKSQMSSGRGTNVQYLNYSKNELGIDLKIPGEFNKLNARAAFQVGLLLGIKPALIQQSLTSYPGVGRRFEYIGNYNGAKVYSDFGHHPTEIAKTMEAAREKFPNQRILLVYQPHMFSRTKALFDDFVKVFQNLPVDKAFIIDIYPSREIDTGLVTSQQLVKVINKPSISHIGCGITALEKIKPEIQKGDIIFFMSAGDTDKLAKELVM